MGLQEVVTALLCPFWDSLELSELARLQGVRPVERAEDLVAPVWESAEEMNRFLADVYASRTRRGKTKAG